MRLSQKIVLTLLIAFALTVVFGVLAYTGLFGVLETEFFSERVRADQQLKLEKIAQGTAAWNDDVLSRFSSLARDRNFEAVYSPSQRAEEIQARAESIDSLGDRLIGFLGLRVVDDGGAMQYSSFAADIAAEQPGSRRVYLNWDQLEDSFPLSGISNIERETGERIIYDGERGRIIYLVPSVDRAFVVRGWMVVYLSPLGLADHLSSGGMTVPGAVLEIISDRGVIVDIRSEQADSVKGAIERLWPKSAEPADFAPLADAAGERYWLVSTVAADGTWVGKLVPGRLLGFSVLVQIIILSAFFITLALLVFLILNLRQDRTEILRRRVNRLQVNLLRDWLEHHEGRKLRTADLESRRGEVKTELRSGLGRLRGTAEAAADEMIDEGWTRITEILAEKDAVRDNGSAGGAGAESGLPIDMKQLEDMITRAVAEVNRAAGTGARSSLSVDQVAAPVLPVPGQPIDVDIVGDGDEGDELDEVEVLDEADELDEVEALDEADELGRDPAGGAEASEIQPLDDLQEDEPGLETLEEADEDQSGELIEISKGAEGGRLYMFDKQNQNDIEVSDGDLEDLEELDELEEVEEVEEVEELPEDDTVSSDADKTVRFIDIAEVLPTSEVSESRAGAGASGTRDDGISMESLIMTRTTGILPGVDSADDFEFDDEIAVLAWSDDGLDYDRYLRGFKKGVTGIYKSLMGLSKQFHAVCGVMMASSSKGIETEYAVGLDDESAATLSAAAGEEAWEQWFSKRRIVFVPDLASSLYAEKTRHVEYRHVKSALFIPVVYNGSQSYVFLGFKEVPQDLMSLLTIGQAVS